MSRLGPELDESRQQRHHADHLRGRYRIEAEAGARYGPALTLATDEEQASPERHSALTMRLLR